MRDDAAAADRAKEVRGAARAWRRANAIDEKALRAVEAAYPDDRVRLGPTFRSLAFLFTSVAVLALIGFLMLILRPGQDGFGLLFLFVGAGLVALTELQTGAMRRSEGGTEAATAWLGLGSLLLAASWFVDEVLHLHGAEWRLAMWSLTAVAFGAAAVRWGSAEYALVASAASFVALAQAPAARLVWLAAALVAAPFLLRGSESPALPPAHRQCCRAALAVGLVAAYLALNLVSWDHGWIESLGATDASGPPPAALRPIAIAGTAVVPLGLIGWGIATRRRLVLDLGVLLLVSSLVTLRWYVHVAPLWVLLAAAGAASMALALAVRRVLDSAPGGEKRGFTAAPLFEDPAGRQGLATALTIAAASRRGPEATADTRLRPGGGGYGGGGASGQY